MTHEINRRHGPIRRRPPRRWKILGRR
jgi:hypothetical protein